MRIIQTITELTAILSTAYNKHHVELHSNPNCLFQVLSSTNAHDTWRYMTAHPKLDKGRDVLNYLQYCAEEGKLFQVTIWRNSFSNPSDEFRVPILVFAETAWRMAGEPLIINWSDSER